MRLRGMDQAEAERQNIQSRLNYIHIRTLRLERRIALVLATGQARLGRIIWFHQHKFMLLATALLTLPGSW